MEEEYGVIKVEIDDLKNFHLFGGIRYNAKHLEIIVTELRSVPPTPPSLPTPAWISVDCKYKNKCTEPTEKCRDCKNNEAKSYFEAIKP